MIRSNRFSVVMTALFLAAFLAGCGNPLEGGSEPSGAVLRVMSVSPSDVEQDLYFCEGNSVDYATVDVQIRNDSTPNFEDSPTTPDGTNSFVTLNRYRVDYAVLNSSATLPGLDGGGFTVGIDKDGTGTVSVLVITEPILEYIRSNYPAVGFGQSMVVRADITIWGQDAFQVDVNAHASVTMTINDFDPCTQDILPEGEASN